MSIVGDAYSDKKDPSGNLPYKDDPVEAPPPYAPPEISSNAAGPSHARPTPQASSLTHSGGLSSSHSSPVSSSAGGRATAVDSSTSTRSWFSSFIPASTKPTTELLTTIHSLLRELVQRPIDPTSTIASPESYTSNILTSCREACIRQGVNYSEVLQDSFIEGHGPVYWATITRQRSRSEDDEANTTPTLALRLLSEMSPPKGKGILPRTVADIRQACLANSDHAALSIVKSKFPKPFALYSGSDEMILGLDGLRGEENEEGKIDVVRVEEASGSGTGQGEQDMAFVVRFEIIKFALRMRISKVVRIEWIARGRLWFLQFSNSPTSATPITVTLGLSDGSQSTYVDSRLTILPASSLSADPNNENLIPGSYSSLPSASTASHAPQSRLNPSTPSIPPIIVRLQCSRKQLLGEPLTIHEARQEARSRRRAQRGKGRARGGGPGNAGTGGGRWWNDPTTFMPKSCGYEIEVGLDERILGAGADGEGSGSAYVDGNGTLKGMVEARLVKYMSDDCIIC